MPVSLRTTPTKLIPSVFAPWTPAEGMYGKKRILSCVSAHRPLCHVRMVTVLRAVWGMMKMHSFGIMTNYRGHSLATDSPKLLLSGGVALGLISDIGVVGFGTVRFCWTGSVACD